MVVFQHVSPVLELSESLCQFSGVEEAHVFIQMVEPVTTQELAYFL